VSILARAAVIAAAARQNAGKPDCYGPGEQYAINPAFENKLYHSPRLTLLLRSEIKDCSCVPAP